MTVSDKTVRRAYQIRSPHVTDYQRVTRARLARESLRAAVTLVVIAAAALLAALVAAR